MFVLTESPEHEWVYKIPAAFGYILPQRRRPTAAEPGPAGGLKRLMFDFLVRYPHAAAESLQRRLGADDGDRGYLRTLLLRGLNASSAAAVEWRDWLLKPYFRHARARGFTQMLGTLQQLSRCGADDVVLPFQILRSCSATLRVGDRVSGYVGPMLVQRRTSFLQRGDFHRFQWSELVEAQQLLWRHGFALTGRNEILGPTNWSLLEGRLVLADTSSIVRRFELAHRALSEEALAARENMVYRILRESGNAESIDVARDYFRFVRSGIDQPTLTRLWRSAVDAA